MINKSTSIVVLATILALGVIIAAPGAFADICINCSANGGDGGDGGSATAGDVGPGGSCFAQIIGNECGGSTGSNEPRGGQAGNGGDGGDAIIFGSKSSINRNMSDTGNTSDTG